MEISVIVPVYNAVNYIEKCIHSILNQTYQQFELIVVNDGSTDNSLEKLHESLPIQKNIKIISQNNQGVSRARNTGIQHATGDYVTFIDCDDYVSSNYLQTLIEATHNGEFDWVLSGTSYIQENNEIRALSLTEDVWKQHELGSKYYYIDYTTSIHGKLYRKDIIDKHNLRFDTSMSFAEDRDFNVEFLKYIDKAHNIPFIGYKYCTDIPDSLSKKNYHYKFRNDCIYWNKVLSLNLISSPFKIFVANRLYNAIVDNISTMVNWLELSEVLHIISIDYTKEDKQLIINYKSDITAPKWQKNIVITSPSLYCILLSIKNHFK